MAITAFQVFETEIYNFIKHNKDLLSGQESDSRYSGKDENQKALKFQLESLKKSLKKLDETSFTDLLTELFLKVNEIYSNTHYIGELSRLRKNSKVASPEFFDAYFTLTLTEELSNSEIKNIIDTTSKEAEFTKVIISLIKDNKISTFLQRIQDFTREDIPKENFQTIFNVLMNLSDMIPENRNGMFSFGNRTEVMRIFYQLYSQLENEESVYKLFKEAIQNAEDSIYMSCHEISLLMKQHGEYENHDEKDEKAITNEQLQDLKKILLLKINDWLKVNFLFDHRDALSIMYLWKRIDEKSCLSYIEENIKTQERLIKFLQVFVYYSYSQTMGDYTEKKSRKFNYKAVKDFIDVELQIENVKAINDELNGMEQFCVDSFIGFYENKITSDEF